MKVYLIQHGESVEKEVNPERPLSEKGKQEVERLGQFLSELNIQVSDIFHSGKLRAKETAEIIADKLHFKKILQVRRGIDPLDPVGPIFDEINLFENDTMMVGHLPFMSQLVSKLVINDENKTIASYVPGSLVCLEKIKENNNLWSIIWMLRPEMFKAT